MQQVTGRSRLDFPDGSVSATVNDRNPRIHQPRHRRL
jgi:hypothetical protein